MKVVDWDEQGNRIERELKPCPFCGSERLSVSVPGTWFHDCYPYTKAPYFVQCRDCGTNNLAIFRNNEALDWSAPHKSRTAAIEAWNRRAESQCESAQVSASQR